MRLGYSQMRTWANPGQEGQGRTAGQADREERGERGGFKSASEWSGAVEPYTCKAVRLGMGTSSGMGKHSPTVSPCGRSASTHC